MKKTVLIILFFCTIFIESQAQWVKQISHTKASLWETKFISPDNGYAIGWIDSTSSFLSTNNGGKNWTAIDIPNTYMFSVQFLDSLNGYIAGYDFGCGCGYIRKTPDGGNKWTDTRLNETFGLYRIIMKDKNNGWACGYQGRILHTSNGWATHDSGSTGTNSVVFRELSAPNSDTLYAGEGSDFATQNLIYRSIDKGKTWQKIQDFGGKFSIAGLHFLNGKTGFISGSNGVDAIMKTTNAGQTWTVKYKGSNSSDLVDDISFSSVMGYAVSAYGKILKTYDKGESWVSEKTPVSNSLYAISMVNDFTGYAVGESGTVIKRESSTGIEGLGKEPGSINAEIYPNPFSNQASLSFNIDKAGFISIEIYDIQGRMVKAILNSAIESGNQNINLERKNLHTGIYYLRIRSGNDNVVKKIVVQ